RSSKTNSSEVSSPRTEGRQSAAVSASATSMTNWSPRRATRPSATWAWARRPSMRRRSLAARVLRSSTRVSARRRPTSRRRRRPCCRRASPRITQRSSATSAPSSASRVLEYNFGIQRELGFQTAREIRYVGSYSNNLIRAVDYNQVDIRSNGFLADFIRARNNLALAPGGLTSGTNFNCSPAFTGCVPLQIIGTSAVGALSNATILNRLRDGQVADLALAYVQGGLTNGFKFLPNPN